MTHHASSKERPTQGRSVTWCVLAALLFATGCTGATTGRVDLRETDLTAPLRPEGAPSGTCWDRMILPAIIETVTVQVQTAPEIRGQDGALLQPASFRTETRQDIVRPRGEAWVETPCPPVLTPEFIASLQRALKARGHYHGMITGGMGAETRGAIRSYQETRGLESATLSIETARSLGLIAVEPR